MPEQTTLDFDRPAKTRARRDDPDTSHAAAAEIGDTAARQSRFMLQLVRKYPGCTSAELAAVPDWPAEWSTLDRRYIAARRLPELRPRWVINGPKRHCQRTGKLAYTWQLAEMNPHG
jgi:hypothetical protein